LLGVEPLEPAAEALGLLRKFLPRLLLLPLVGFLLEFVEFFLQLGEFLLRPLQLLR
jgi:hypothetical protein